MYKYFIIGVITLQNGARSFQLVKIKGLLYNYVNNFVERYATALGNHLITTSKLESFCLDGICYYTLCKYEKCVVQYCIYVLVTGEKTCSPTEFAAVIDVNANKEEIVNFIMKAVNSYKNNNNEDNEIKP